MRVLGDDDVSKLFLDEVVIFEEQLECRLKIPCCQFLEAVLAHFRL